MEDNKSNNSIPSLEDQAKNQGLGLTYAKPEVTPPVGEEKTGEENKTTPVVETEVDWKAKFEATQLELEAAKKVAPVVIELTPEQIEARAKEEENEILNFIATEKKQSVLEYEKYVNSLKVADKDYHLEKYKAERAGENLSDDELLADYEDEYKINSEDDKVRARMEKRIQNETKAYRNEEGKEFHNIRDEFKTSKTIKTKRPVFEKLINEAKPEVKISFTPEGFKEAIEIDVDYSDILPELQKELSSDPYFNTFTDEKVDTQKAINEFITKAVKGAKSESIAIQLANKAFEKLKTTLEIGSLHPIVALGGSKVENRTPDNYAGLRKQIEEVGIVPQPPKTT